jgi:uncharacterized membrane protein YcaP (DUF421 family)
MINFKVLCKAIRDVFLAIAVVVVFIVGIAAIAADKNVNPELLAIGSSIAVILAVLVRLIYEVYNSKMRKLKSNTHQ